MYKTYTVTTAIDIGGSGRTALLIDTVPDPLAQAGPKLILNREGESKAVVEGAGNDLEVDFSKDAYIYTHGLMNCFAVCAAWDKVGNVFSKGYLAHVS